MQTDIIELMAADYVDAVYQGVPCCEQGSDSDPLTIFATKYGLRNDVCLVEQMLRRAANGTLGILPPVR